MKLIIGLGNPGEQYAGTRHNIGARVVSEFHKKHLGDFSKFKAQKKFNSKVAKGKLGEKDVILALPQAYMNNSGLAVKQLAASYRLVVTDLLIIYDELDLPLGSLRIRQGGSAAGHNGIKSISQHLASENFLRFRIGIGNDQRNKIPAEKFVLRKFSKAEEKKLQQEVTPTAIAALETTLAKNAEAAMQEFN